MSSQYFEIPKPRILSHRGYHTTEGSGTPPKENTLAAFSEAFKLSPYIETDCWLTQDGVPVLHHDRTLLRVFGNPAAIADLSMAELKKIAPEVPSLKDSLEKFPKAYFNIEIKHKSYEAVLAVKNILSECRAFDRVLLAAEKTKIMSWIRKEMPQVPTSVSYLEALAYLVWQRTPLRHILKKFPTPAKAFQIPTHYKTLRFDTKEFIDIAHAQNMEVHYWTINSEDEIKRLLALGADGIVSDYPNRVAKVIRR